MHSGYSKAHWLGEDLSGVSSKHHLSSPYFIYEVFCGGWTVSKILSGIGSNSLLNFNSLYLSWEIFRLFSRNSMKLFDPSAELIAIQWSVFAGSMIFFHSLAFSDYNDVWTNIACLPDDLLIMTDSENVVYSSRKKM